MASKLGVATLASTRALTSPIRKPLVSIFSASPLSISLKDASSTHQFMGVRRLTVRRKFFLLPSNATTDKSGQVGAGDETVDSNVLQYCSIDGKDKKKSIGELEQEFLQALQAFYYEGKAVMSNEEFDNLKEELMWEGSSIVMLSPDEQRFLEASMAYVSGNPILSDAEFDELKRKLKMEGSMIVVEGPRCSLRSRKV